MIFEHARFALLQRLTRLLFPRYRLQFHQIDWWSDPGFDRYLERFGESNGLNAGRRWTLFQLTRLVADIPGDTAECGVFQGAGSYLICKGVQSHQYPRHHLVFDSFEGLSEPSTLDGGAWRKGNMSCDLETVS